MFEDIKGLIIVDSDLEFYSLVDLNLSKCGSGLNQFIL